jgi:hypothetical protein
MTATAAERRWAACRLTVMKRVQLATVSVIVLLLIGGCGGNEEPARPAPTSPSATSPTATSPPLASPAPATPPPSPGTAAPAQPITISGTVEEGVEAGCLLLKEYLLIGGRDQGIRAGAAVTVTGRTRPDLATTCQQGTPLEVETVTHG